MLLTYWCRCCCRRLFGRPGQLLCLPLSRCVRDSSGGLAAARVTGTFRHRSSSSYSSGSSSNSSSTWSCALGTPPSANSHARAAHLEPCTSTLWRFSCGCSSSGCSSSNSRRELDQPAAEDVTASPAEAAQKKETTAATADSCIPSLQLAVVAREHCCPHRTKSSSIQRTSC